MTTEYDETMDVSDLFESIFEEIVSDAQAEVESGSVLTDTVTSARLKLVHAQKAKSLLKHVKEVKLGKAGWITPATELILLEDGYDVIKHAFDRVANGEQMAFLRACPEFARHGVLESLKVVEDDLRTTTTSTLTRMTTFPVVSMTAPIVPSMTYSSLGSSTVMTSVLSFSHHSTPKCTSP
jgi:hypothetical protein